jgi:scyllo-inositol 2-dehydrogenase (NADP+)
MIRFGIIGTNWITEDFIRSAREAEGFALTAVFSRSEENARPYAAKHGIPHVYTDFDSFANSPELDAVYIASPNFLHAEQAIRCMNSGKHVLCEKPIASNAREVEQMIAAARDNGVVLMEAMKSTFTPTFLAIRDNVHRIGPVRRFFASYCQYSSRYDEYLKGNVLNAFKPELSNGALMDLGVYCLYPLVVLFGEPDRVQASAYLLETGVDGQGSILLQYGQMDAVVHYSKITDSYASAEIQGEKGTIVFEKISRPDKAELRLRGGEIVDLTMPQSENSMMYEVQEFIALINEGKLESALNSHDHSLKVMRIMDEARKQVGIVYPADQE